MTFIQAAAAQDTSHGDTPTSSEADGHAAAQGGLAATYVNMSEEEASDIGARHFGVDGPIIRFATEKDDTFRIGGTAGSRFILKVANPSEDEAEIALQIDLLDHVAARAPSLPVPRVIADRDGRRSFHYEDRSGQMRRVRLMSYLEGTPLAETSTSAAEREQIGRMLARLRLATADFSHPAESRVLAWDVKHLSQLKHLLSEFSDPARRAKLAEGFQRFATIEQRLVRCRTQVVHNDFSKSNLVVDHAHPEFLTGVIDFGDAVKTAIAVDVSTAVLNQMLQGGDDIFHDARDLLRGYLAEADLTAEELSLIPHLVMGRLVARTLLSTWRANLFPENSPYLLRNTEQGWAQLDWFLARSMDDVSDQFRTMA